MLTPEFSALFERFDAASSEVDAARGSVAAALWTVDVHLSDRTTFIAPREDSETLDVVGNRLAIRRNYDGKLGLWIVGPAETIPAARASAPLQIAAIQRLPRFFEFALTAIEKANTESEKAVSLAKQALTATHERQKKANPEPA